LQTDIEEGSSDEKGLYGILDKRRGIFKACLFLSAGAIVLSIEYQP